MLRLIASVLAAMMMLTIRSIDLSGLLPQETAPAAQENAASTEISLSFLDLVALMGGGAVISETPEQDVLLHAGAEFEPKNRYKPTEAELEQARAVIESRLKGLDFQDCKVVADKQTNSITISLSWQSAQMNFEPEETIAKLGLAGKLAFVDPQGNVVMDGSHVTKSEVQSDDLVNQYVVYLAFDEEGAKLLADATAKLVGQKITICMDDQEICSPTVEEAISGGEAIINNMDSAEEATILANMISAGELPFPLVLNSQHATSTPDTEEQDW